MRGTKDARWAAVYGAAYAYWSDCEKTSAKLALEFAVQTANEAIAAEPEEAGELETLELRPGYGLNMAELVDEDGDKAMIPRSEAAALARLLERFAETGEL